MDNSNNSQNGTRWSERSWLAMASVVIAGLAAVLLIVYWPGTMVSRNPDPDKWMKFATILLFLSISACSVILGVVALISAWKRGVRLTNAASAKAGVSVGMAATLFAASLAFIFLADERREVENRTRYGNTAQIAMALQLYSDDNGGRLPPSSNWRQCLRSYINPGSSLRLFPRPTDRLAYAMNSRLGGAQIKSIRHPEKTILIFESTPGKYLASGPESFPMPERGNYRIVLR